MALRKHFTGLIGITADKRSRCCSDGAKSKSASGTAARKFRVFPEIMFAHRSRLMHPPGNRHVLALHRAHDRPAPNRVRDDAIEIPRESRERFMLPFR